LGVLTPFAPALPAAFGPVAEPVPEPELVGVTGWDVVVVPVAPAVLGLPTLMAPPPAGELVGGDPGRVEFVGVPPAPAGAPLPAAGQDVLVVVAAGGLDDVELLHATVATSSAATTTRRCIPGTLPGHGPAYARGRGGGAAAMLT
jgi:hypothetical protein